MVTYGSISPAAWGGMIDGGVVSPNTPRRGGGVWALEASHRARLHAESAS